MPSEMSSPQLAGLAAPLRRLSRFGAAGQN